ncbi:DUF6980 family protein [Yinghuangia soli]|uniref:DUF6980 domain-containing protein n=1 Tax=Yinghuangia soli TaxID=2908204 RepID=A0AA41PUX7_9ACTN|nr:hypothetical protein [Yinghuangia soli]MCF2525666.1 hypothetical protein [Yinghuangia soli]
MSTTPTHCCETMTRQVDAQCDTHPDPFECPDALIDFSAKFQEYGLVIHDGGASVITIAFCPWCGHRLPDSRRDAWFEALESQGIDPWNDEIPPEFDDHRWLDSPPA